MSLQRWLASALRSAWTVNALPSKRRSCRFLMETTNKSPLGSQPKPDGSSSWRVNSVVFFPSGVTVQTHWSCMSENHSWPLRHLGPSVKQRLSSRIVMIGPLLSFLQDTSETNEVRGERTGGNSISCDRPDG
jgi:hypothetical protein